MTLRYGRKTILSLCDGLGSWSDPYENAGYNVIRIDTLTGNDARLFRLPRMPRGELAVIHGILAAPPCTYFAASGARWQRSDDEMREALSVVDACCRIILATEPAWWVIENPTGKLSHYLGKPSLIFDPCDYGDPYRKRTCLWGKFNAPEQTPVEPITFRGGSHSYDHFLTVGKSLPAGVSPRRGRQMLRSQTPLGFARAFFQANP